MVMVWSGVGRPGALGAVTAQVRQSTRDDRHDRERRSERDAAPDPRRPGSRHARDRLGRRPQQGLRVRDPALAVPVRVLPGRGRDAGLTRQRTAAHPPADPAHRPPPGRQLRCVAALGGRPWDGLLPVPSPARSLSVRGLHCASPAREHGPYRPSVTGRDARGASMIIVTTPYLSGHNIVESKGMWFGLVVRSRGLGGNIMAGLRSLGGGEIHEYPSLLEDTRRQALDRLGKNATLVGANAIVSMRFDSSELSGTMSEIVAYGTAVIVAEDASATPPA